VINLKTNKMENLNKEEANNRSLPHINITINGKTIEIKSSIEHDDVVMFWLIESIYALRNKQYKQFLDENNN
jgi:hypothetical protein